MPQNTEHPLTGTEKLHMLPAQEREFATYLLQITHNPVDNSASIWFDFAPTTHWINEFRKVGYRFFASEDFKRFELRKVPDMAEPEDGSPWIPQNGEWVLCKNSYDSDNEWFECIYVGLYPVADKKGSVILYGSTLYHVDQVKPKPKKVQVTLDELLSVYASVKGLTQDGVELKPE